MLAGVLLVQRAPSLPPAWLAVPVLVTAVAIWFRAGVWRPFGALLAGLALASLHGAYALSLQWPAERGAGSGWVQGRVVGLPDRSPDAWRFAFRVEAGEGQAAALAGRLLRVSWFADHDPGQRLPEVEAGSRWRLNLRWRAPTGLANPGGFDLERRAVEQRIAALAQVQGASAQAILQEQGRGLDAWRERQARHIAQATGMPSERFVRALALGDTRALDDRDWEILRVTGLTHLIAISGFHVGLAAGFGALLARLAWWLAPGLGRHWPRPLASAAAALAVAAAYTALAGCALPTVRTLLMIAVLALARLSRRGSGPATGLSLALLAILLADPLAVLAPGFWLSFAGVAWLLWCLPGREGRHPLRGLVWAQVVATAGLSPLTVWFFRQASLAGPLANLAGIPWISLVVVPAALSGLLLAPLHEGAAGWAWRVAAAAMELLWQLLERVAQWPAAFVWLPEPDLAGLALALAGAFWLTLPRGVPGKPLALLLWLPMLWPRQDLPAAGEVDIVQFDVGQGLAVLVRTQRHALLYDAGPAPSRGLDTGEAVVLPALRAMGMRRLDMLVLSHGDNDHAGGAAAVRRGLPVARVLAPRGWAHGGMAPCLAGERWHWDGVDFDWLHPPLHLPYLRNDSSCVLRIRASGRQALLPGDIGRQVEARLARHADIGSDLLLVPHHGSDSSSSLDFLAAVRPRLALLSAGRDNRFGFPKPVVLGRYARYGVGLLDSAGHGSLRIRLGPAGVEVRERFRLDRPRYWRHAGGGYAIGGPPEPDR
ncbi:DNA internalization-related competence protein ComEC/Rec2 [Arenimonas fontis]|uniref:DNA internalization-related competence protein ComEC/Rec2 n=1 Tax=Arenimonas fontis TaxID=2608255 RepID=A0A5B2ZBC6_9GAMM|nr:DNA internalization-related competence protein ComEC/Rec2 [Arenimonas fontis]